MTDMLVATAPVFKVAGTARGEIARDLLELTVTHSTAGLATLEVTLLGAGSAGDDPTRLGYLNGDVADFGSEMEVSIGPRGRDRIIFSGVVSAIEARFSEHHAPRVVVFAEDRLMRLRLTRRSRSYEQTTDAEIAGTIARLHGLTADCPADGPRYDWVQQFQQSDLAFLRDRARLIGAELWVDGDGLHFVSRHQRRGNEVVLSEGFDMLACDVRADVAHQRTSVTVSGYDADDRTVINEVAGAEAIQAEITGGRSGPDVLRATLGEVAGTRARDVPLTSGEAAAFARAEMLRRCRGFVTARVVANGNPELVVGSRVTLHGVGRRFEGPGYYATRVVHSYDLVHGHRTLTDLERSTVAAG